MNTFTATREIGIDAGHRVTYHGSKCRNVHGHRYRVLATVTGTLVESGPSQGMVQDFGDIKRLMMEEIDAKCDHGLILWVRDPLVPKWIKDGTLVLPPSETAPLGAPTITVSDHMWLTEHVERWHSLEARWDGGKLYLVDFVPTAENLAAHWFARLAPRVTAEVPTGVLEQVTVWETPNCSATFTKRAK